MELIDWGNDDERKYVALLQIGTGPLKLTSRALLGIEITTKDALEGPGIYIDFLFLKIRIC